MLVRFFFLWFVCGCHHQSLDQEKVEAPQGSCPAEVVVRQTRTYCTGYSGQKYIAGPTVASPLKWTHIQQSLCKKTQDAKNVTPRIFSLEVHLSAPQQKDSCEVPKMWCSLDQGPATLHWRGQKALGGHRGLEFSRWQSKSQSRWWHTTWGQRRRYTTWRKWVGRRRNRRARPKSSSHPHFSLVTPLHGHQARPRLQPHPRIQHQVLSVFKCRWYLR